MEESLLHTEHTAERVRRGSVGNLLADPEKELRPRSLHGSVHPLLSGLFVVSCLLNGGLFLWSNLSVGAEVWTTLCLTEACPTPTREKVFEFTLRSSVEAMWKAKTYYVAVLIIAGSAVWPYVKMVAMLVAWFWHVEEGSRDERWRGIVARTLDLAGKFSLIDGFVMVLLSVGFGFTIGPVLPPFLMLTVDVEVTTEFAVFSGVLASAWSAMQSHLLLLAHYRAVHGSSSRESSQRCLKSASTHEDTAARGCSLSTALFAVVVVLLSASALAIGAIGATQYDVIRYEFLGFAGSLVATEPPSLTLVELGQLFFSDGIAGTSLEAGIWMVTVGLYLFTLGVPTLQLLACCAHVLTRCAGDGTSDNAPLMAKISWWSGGAAALLATWSALDIFLVACLAAMLELGPLTSTIGDKLCAEFEGFVPEGEDCFRSEGKIEVGAYWLGSAAGLWLLVNCIALCRCASL